MDYEKMLLFTDSQKMSQNNCSAHPSLNPFKLGEIAAHTSAFLQPVDTYFAYADNFDLSLLPQVCDPENIPTTVYHYTECHTPTTPPAPQIKIEQIWSCSSKDIKQEQNYMVSHEQQQQQLSQLQPLSKSPNQLIPPPPYPHIYPTPQSSPAQSEYNFPHTQFAGCYDSLSSSRSSLFPLSPCPSLDAANIKQEYHILPPSPPESNCEAPSPYSLCSDIKTEPIDCDVEALVDLNCLLAKPFNDLASQQTTSNVAGASTLIVTQDHQVLREYLEDTTFQKKHNLKPLAVESFIGGLEEVRGDIEPVISLALEHVKQEADETCAKLHISQDPSAWTPTQVHAWLRSTVDQYKLLQIEDLEAKFCEDGAALILLSEEEFTQRAPECGSVLHARLEIWKLAYSGEYQNNTCAIQQQQAEQIPLATGPLDQNLWSNDDLQNFTGISMAEDSDDDDDHDLLPSTSAPQAAIENAVSVATSEPKRTTPGRNGGSHIHLWQFLKELLAAPQLNGTAIRWIDRSKGIFKIEDSVRVAKLWGRRKNRPAMNYDKLSRSIRQYYKKGIMKKTERSQRLVYQFCHPYHL